VFVIDVCSMSLTEGIAEPAAVWPPVYQNHQGMYVMPIDPSYSNSCGMVVCSCLMAWSATPNR